MITKATAKHLSVLEKSLALITAALALITAILVYKTTVITQAKDQAQEAAANTGDDLSSLQASYNALQAENARLKSQLDNRVSSGSTGPTADPPVSTTATVRHSGQLVLASGTFADLDSPSTDPQWGVSADQIIADIHYDGRLTPWNVPALYLGATKADYEVCRNTTGYGRVKLSPSEVDPGAYLCIKTTSGRYSAVRIIQFDQSKVTLDIVTYNL